MKQQIVIILPGWQHTTKNWIAFSDAFEIFKIDFFVCDFVEFTDFEKSPKSTVHEVAQYINDKLQNDFSNRDIVLVGHSFGGRVAVELCKLNQLNISKLVLIGSPNIYRPDFFTRVKKIVAKFLRPILNYFPESLKVSFRSDDYKNAKNSPLHELFVNTITFDQTDTLRSLKLDCLLVWGEHDEQVPVAIAYEIQALLENSKLEIIRNIGHNVPTENPKLLAGLITNYVKSN
jgi:pimeloyl-ACP methyl ester carboxylesterase